MEKSGLSGKVVLITGGNTGIGREISKVLVLSGAKVYVNYIHYEDEFYSLKEELKDFSGNITGKKADISHESACIQIVEDIIHEDGNIDILINNAGILRFGFLISTKEEDWYDVLRVNLSGTFFCIKSVLKHMVKNNSGRIINIGSVLSLKSMIGATGYSASKAGIIGLTKALAKEVENYDIQINTMALGAIEGTGLLKKLKEKYKIVDKTFGDKMCTIDEIIDLILFLSSCNHYKPTGRIFLVGSEITV
ncbi:MAG: SDR family oxidoreductase [Spirochaetales bacterium]|nr:SDR family oxidoreductase [Spirochaetales bacterium]